VTDAVVHLIILAQISCFVFFSKFSVWLQHSVIFDCAFCQSSQLVIIIVSVVCGVAALIILVVVCNFLLRRRSVHSSDLFMGEGGGSTFFLEMVGFFASLISETRPFASHIND